MLLSFALSLALIAPPAAKGPQAGPKVGDAWTVTYTQTFLEPGTDEVVEAFTYRVEAKALKSTPKGVEAEERTELLESRIGEIVVPPPKGATPMIAKVLFGPNGERALEPAALADPLEFRLARMTWFIGSGADPRGSTASWKVELPASVGQPIPGASASFELQKRNQRKGRASTWFSAKFLEQGGAKPMAAEGTFVIDDATGLPVEIEMNADNALIPGGDGTRYDLRLKLSAEIKGR